MNNLILISGPSCTGKTTLGVKLSDHFKLPFIYRDGIKEQLFDDLGYRDREWSRKIGRASYSLLYQMAEIFLRSGQAFILESNFNPQFDSEKLLNLKKKYPFHSIEIRCRCEGVILFERFKARSESGERHPGHGDDGNYEEFREKLLEGETGSLGLGGEEIIWDTTDWDKLDYQELFDRMEALISADSRPLTADR